MSERAAMDDEAMKLGFLMESAHAQQKFAEVHLEKLQAHTHGLDDVVRDTIRRTLVEEFRVLTAECERTIGALRDVRGTARRNTLLWSAGIAIACALPGVVVTFSVPSSKDIAALRAQRDALSRDLSQLESRGAKVEWRSCGHAARLCVRIDRRAPVYGEAADLYIVKGY